MGEGGGVGRILKMGRNIGNIGDFEFLPSQHRGHELSSHILTCTVLRTNV